MIYYWWIQLFSTCPHRPLQFGTSHYCHVPGTTSCCRSLSSKGVEWHAAEWWCYAGGPGQKGSVASLNHRLNPCKLYKHQPTGSSFLWLISSGLSRRFYLQCSCRKQVHLSPSPSTSSWNRKIGHNPSTEHRVSHINVADCLPMAHKHQRGGTTLQAQLCHKAHLELNRNELTRRQGRPDILHRSWLVEHRAKQRNEKEYGQVWVRKFEVSCSWRWQVLQVQGGRGPLANERQTTIGMKAFWDLHPIPAGFGLILQWGSVKSRDIRRLQQVEGELTLPKLCSYASGKMARFFSVAASLTHQA